MNRNGQMPRANGQSGIPGGSVTPNNVGVGSGGARLTKRHGRTGGRYDKLITVGTVVLLLSIAILIGAVASYFAFGNYGSQAQYINKGEYQAVFINVNGTTGGQVYFGHLDNITNNYLRLTNVFYIQNQSSNNSSSSNQAYTLVKLGCELHAPEDEMIINRSQVYFWENLKSSGQVAQKIAQYYKDNPNGQKCSTVSSSASQQSANTQSSANAGTSTSGSKSSTTSKP